PSRVDGFAWGLEPQLPWYGFPGRAPLRPAPASLPGVSAAAGDGVERKGRDARRDPGRVRHVRSHMGRARLECATLVFPASAPGHGEGGARLPCTRERLEPLSGAAESRARQLLR